MFDQFYKKAEEILVDGNTIQISLDANVFGQESDTTIFVALEDVQYLCKSQELTCNDIIVYIR